MARYVEHSDQWTGPNRNPPSQLRGWYVNNDDGDPMTGPFDKEEEAFEELDYLNEKHAKPMRHCPHCFESSGYVWEHGNDWEGGPWSHQTNIPCRFCDGTGLVRTRGPLFEIRDKTGEEPCGECHLQAGETCDICGAIADARVALRDKPRFMEAAE